MQIIFIFLSFILPIGLEFVGLIFNRIESDLTHLLIKFNLNIGRFSEDMSLPLILLMQKYKEMYWYVFSSSLFNNDGS